jgi:hypothetical protein
MYTVALAVDTLPHTTFAEVPTVKFVPLPATVTSPPCSVLCLPASWAGASLPGTTWKVRIFVSVALSASTLSRSAFGIFANASLVGADTVMPSALLSESTRLAFFTAVTSVLSSGFPEAAVATTATTATTGVTVVVAARREGDEADRDDRDDRATGHVLLLCSTVTGSCQPDHSRRSGSGML